VAVNELPMAFHLSYSLEHRLPTSQALKTVARYLCACGEWEDTVLAADAGSCHDMPNKIHINIYVIYTLKDDISAKLNGIGEQLAILLTSEMGLAFVRLDFDHICTLSPDSESESEQTIH